MAAEDESNFFSRWSRRKVQVRTGEPLPAEPPPPKPAAPVAVAVPPVIAEPASAEAPVEQPPVLTLDDVARLTPDSDYSSFVARGVPTDVRNAAVKKLFTDPHYNVMDGLDTYIDDYSQPSPLSAADMARMVGAQFLKLVDDPNEVKPATATADQASPAAQADTTDTVAEQTEPDVDGDTIAVDTRDTNASDSPDPPHDDHADLQLQPDDVPEPPGSGRRAG